MARRSKLTPKVQEDFCNALQIGATIEIAAGYAGIPERTIYDWLERGRKEEERLAQTPPPEPNPNEARYLRFSQAVRESRISADIVCLQTVEAAARTDPAWAWKLLQARHPKDYNPRQQVDVTTDGNPLPITIIEVVKSVEGESDG